MYKVSLRPGGTIYLVGVAALGAAHGWLKENLTDWSFVAFGATYVIVLGVIGRLVNRRYETR